MRNRSLFILAIIILVVSVTLAQQPSGSPPTQPSMQMGQMSGCQGMMQSMQKMPAALNEMDARLAPLVAEMNKATGSEKVDRMAAVLNEMTAQRKQMHDQVAGMMSGMMGGAGGGMSCAMPKDSAPAQPAKSEKR
jgi:hypothetical protein